MVPEEKGSITLSKEAAIIFATAKFKPFQNRIKNNPQKQIHFLNYMKTKILNHFIYSISDLRNLIKDNALFHNYISQETKKSQTSLNPSIAHFLKHKTITMNDQNSLRAYLIIDKSDVEIMGYFCLKNVNIKLEKDVSGKTKRRY